MEPNFRRQLPVIPISAARTKIIPNLEWDFKLTSLLRSFGSRKTLFASSGGAPPKNASTELLRSVKPTEPKCLIKNEQGPDPQEEGQGAKFTVERD